MSILKRSITTVKVVKNFQLTVLMDHVRFRFVLFFLNQGFDKFQRTITQNDQWNLNIIFSQKIRVWGQITNFDSLRVKFRSWLKVGKVYMIYSISEWHSWRQLFKKEDARSPKVKNLKSRSNFELLWNKVDFISKWHSWR